MWIITLFTKVEASERRESEKKNNFENIDEKSTGTIHGT